MMADRSHPPVDRRRIEAGGSLIAGKDRDDVGLGGQSGQTMRCAPRGEDRPIGIIRPSRRAGTRGFGKCGSALNLFVEDCRKRRFGGIGRDRYLRAREVGIDKERRMWVRRRHLKCVARQFRTP